MTILTLKIKNICSSHKDLKEREQTRQYFNIHTKKGLDSRIHEEALTSQEPPGGPHEYSGPPVIPTAAASGLSENLSQNRAFPSLSILPPSFLSSKSTQLVTGPTAQGPSSASCWPALASEGTRAISHTGPWQWAHPTPGSVFASSSWGWF